MSGMHIIRIKRDKGGGGGGGGQKLEKKVLRNF